MQIIYDVIIIGSGPAGLVASIYASRAQLNTLIIEKNGVSGGQIINTYEVDNYPGFPGINGFDLAQKFRNHCDSLGGIFIKGEVAKFEVDNDIKCITLDNGTIYKSRAVVIAAGAVYRKLNVKGENELLGRGVSYCATCDGAFFKGKTTAVIGGGDVAVEDAVFLSRICKKVYVIHRRDEFRANKSLCSKLFIAQNVEIIWNHTIKEIYGIDKVDKLVLKSTETEEERSIVLDGVFIAIGMIPNSNSYKQLLNINEGGYIIADETCETNIKGVYAAGDIRTKQLKQILTAAADGANAITSIEKYLGEL